MKRKIVTAIVLVVILIAAGLIIWTAESPPAMNVETPADLNGSIFSVSLSYSELNISDPSGFFSFKLGIDYSTNLTQGLHSEMNIYSALVAQAITSSFSKGVSLQLESATLAIDNTADGLISTSARYTSGIQVYSIQNINTDLTRGLHNFTVRLVLQTVDVNYVGSAAGSVTALDMDGNFTMS